VPCSHKYTICSFESVVEKDLVLVFPMLYTHIYKHGKGERRNRGCLINKQTDLVAAAILLVAGDRVHQRRARRAQRGGRRGCPRRHDPHVVGERTGREEPPAAARSLRAVPHQGGPPNSAVHAANSFSLSQMQQTAALASKPATEEADAGTEPPASTPPGINRSLKDCPRAVSVGGLEGFSRETAQQTVSSGGRHGRRAGGRWWTGGGERPAELWWLFPRTRRRAIRSEKARVCSFRLGFDLSPFYFPFLFPGRGGGREPSGLGEADEWSRRRQAKASFEKRIIVLLILIGCRFVFAFPCSGLVCVEGEIS
jgi:hypothetical protein